MPRMPKLMRLSPPWYYGWNIVGTSMVFQALTFGLTIYAFGFWVKPLQAEFGASRAEIMLGMTLLQGVMGFLSPFAGYAMDRRSIRLLVCLGALCMGAGLVLAAYAPNVWVFCGAYGFLVSAGTLLAGPLAGSTLAAKWFRGRRGMAIGWSAVGTSVGGLAMPYIVALLLDDYGWRDTHLILAAILIAIVIPLVWLIVRNTPDDLGVEPDPEAKLKPGAVPPITHGAWTTRTILREANFWAVAIAFGFLTMVFGGVQANLIPLAEDKGYSTQAAASFMTILAAVGILGKVLYGAAADKVDHRLLFWSAAVVLAVPLILLTGTPSYMMMVLISGLLGFATGGFLPLMGAMLGTRFGPAAFGQVMGLLGPFTTPLAMAGPVLASFVFDRSGSYILAFEIFLGMIVIAALMILLLKPTTKPHPDTATTAPAGE